MTAHAALAPFIPEIRDRAAAIEAERAMPEDLARRMADAGLFRMLVPDCYGGGQAHPRQFFDTLASTARADGAVGWVLMIGATTGLLAASLPEPWAQTLYGARPDAITSGVTAPLGRAIRDGSGLRVSGRWPFGSGSNISEWICGGCFIVEDGQPVAGPRGQPEHLLTFFPASDVHILDTWHTTGLRGTGSNDIEVHDAFVPEGRWVTLGGRPLIDAPLYRFPTIGLLALGVSAVALGIAEAALEAFHELAVGKIPTGSTRALAARSSAQKDLAQAEAAIRSARAFTYECIDAAWEHAVAGGRLTLDHKADLRLAATNNTWSAVAAVDALYHAAGGSAVYETSRLQRCFRDVHVATAHIMVAQPTYEVIGKVRLGLDPKTLL